MIDVSNLKAPGWQRVVAELTAHSDDDRGFFARLVRVLAQVSAARQAVLLMPDHTDGEQVEPRVELVWPPAGGEGDRAGAPGGPDVVQSRTDVLSAARAAFESAQARAFSLEGTEQYYTPGSQGGYVLAVPLPPHAVTLGPEAGAPTVPSGVVTLLIEPRSAEAVRSTLAMAELIAGYTHAHAARQALRIASGSSAALDLATRLIASINTAPSFKGACLQLVNDLSRQFKAERVAMGWVKDDAASVQAISDVEHFDRRMAMVVKLGRAMEECLDQEQPVVVPVPPAEGPNADVVLSQAIVHAHRELAAGNVRLKVCSVPLRVGDDVVGVLTMEVVGDGDIQLATIELLQAAMDLIAPVLKIRRSDDRLLPVRAWDSAIRSAGWLVGPKHTAWKLAGLALLVAALFVTFYRTTYRPGAEAVLEPRERRVVSMPFDGVLRSLGEGVEPGKHVTAGQVLAVLDTSELELKLAGAESRALQARMQADAARTVKQQEKAVAAEEEAKQARAEADLYTSYIEKARILSPITGTIIAGELKDRVGSSLKLGEPMLQVADLSDVIVNARVDERDIALIRRAFDEQRGTGQLATKSVPDQAFDFTVERIVPLAVAGEGKNTFEVRCALSSSAPWFRPGMEGVAKFNTERRSLLWIGTRRLMDQVRLWLWW